MSDFVNPSTTELVPSRSEMPAPWIPCTREQLEEWEQVTSKYRKWVTDHIEEMDAGEKAAVDTALLTEQRDSAAAQLDQVEDALRAFMLVVLDELNLHAVKHNAILDAIDNSTNYATLKANIASVVDYPSRTANQLKNAVRGKLGS